MSNNVFIFFLISLLVTIFYSSCKSEYSYKRSERLLELVNLDTTSKFVEYYPNNQLYYAIDTSGGIFFGNYYQFNIDGYLEQYSFQVDSVNATYLIYYDKEGNVIDIVGSPICRKYINFNIKPDSLYIKWLISGFDLKSKEFYILDQNGDFQQIPLKKHPELFNIYIAERTISVSNINNVFEVGNLRCISESGNLFSYYDTIQYDRKASLEESKFQ